MSLKEIKLSPSKIDTFLGCRRLFKYRYILKPSVPLSKYFLIGNIAHKVLELFHKSVCDDDDPRGYRDLLAHCFEKAVKKYNALKIAKNGGIIAISDLYSIKQMMLDYLKLIKRTGMPNIVSVEKMAKIPLSDGVVIWMKADRLDSLGDQEFKVVDYKTSARPASRKDELASVQLSTYGLWVKKCIDADAEVWGEYQYLRHLDKKRGIHTFRITDEMMDCAIDEYQTVAKLLRNGCKFFPNYKYKYCGRICDYQRICLKEN